MSFGSSLLRTAYKLSGAKKAFAQIGRAHV